MVTQPNIYAMNESGIMFANAANMCRDSWPGTPENTDVDETAWMQQCGSSIMDLTDKTNLPTMLVKEYNSGRYPSLISHRAMAFRGQGTFSSSGDRVKDV